MHLSLLESSVKLNLTLSVFAVLGVVRLTVVVVAGFTDSRELFARSFGAAAIDGVSPSGDNAEAGVDGVTGSPGAVRND